MSVRLTPLRVRVALALTLACLPGLALVQGRPRAPVGKTPPQAPADKPPPRAKTAQAWTLDEALGQLQVYPHDPYLQYVALQLARRDKRLDEVGNRVAQLVLDESFAQRNDRANRVDLFSIFTGALAVQESLQLDSMRGPAPARPVAAPVLARGGSAPPPDDTAEKRRKEIIDVVKLTGPTIKSHPWEKMLGGKKPDVGPLARYVPEDFYLAEFRSATRMLELLDSADLWVAHLVNQASREARSQRVGERLRRQLAIETNPLLRPLYDTVIEEVAVTGSDLFVAEGSDVTLLFRLQQPDLFRSRMDSFLDNAARDRPGAKRSEGEYLGIKYVHVTTPERDVHVFSAYPEEKLHVRGNSKAAFFRVLEAIHGKTDSGQAVRRLGDSKEFAYIRTLMPRGAREEDGFLYLSDPFIRHLVGPQLKLTERRRMLCYNHLRMIGHAALLFRTQYGRAPQSLAELVKGGCCPGAFNEGNLVCADGGKYTLSADGTQGVCSHHGRAHTLVPCCETPLAWVTGAEADEYKAFLDQYNTYWRTYFDPIAIRLQVTPQRYRLETIILPLINNSIYQGMAATLGGKPEPLDALPVPKRNIFTVAARLNKESWLPWLRSDEEAGAGRESQLPKGAPRAKGLVEANNTLKQIGLAMHAYQDTNGHFPAAAARGKGGKPLLSWRVHLLPYLEQDALYKEFKLDEPWDSEHNKKLIARMPPLYRGPNAKLSAEGKTPYLVPVGPGTIFGDGSKPPRIADIPDGLSNTILAVEAADERAAVWTKPDDLAVDPKEPLKGLVRPGQDGFLVLMADASTHYLRKDVGARTLNALFTRAGGEPPVELQPAEERRLADLGLELDWLQEVGVSPEEGRRELLRLLRDGLGNQVGLHVYDAPPLFDLDMPRFAGLMFGSFNGVSRFGTDELLASFMISSLNAPVYLSLPVQDAAVVDRFLDRLDRVLVVLARKRENMGGWFRLEPDFYRAKLKGGQPMRTFALSLGPVKWRFHWARVGNGLYVASKPFILEDLVALEAARDKDGKKSPPDPETSGHAMVRLRPRNWNQVLEDYRLGWAENNRQACQGNLGPLSSVGRAVRAQARDKAPGGKELGQQTQRVADQLYAVHFYCPEGGRYVLSRDGKTCTCNVHGDARNPKQRLAPDTASPTRVLQTFGGLTSTLTFLEDGLHAVLTVERK